MVCGNKPTGQLGVERKTAHRERDFKFDGSATVEIHGVDIC
jgi:hypothetical protein